MKRKGLMIKIAALLMAGALMAGCGEDKTEEATSTASGSGQLSGLAGALASAQAQQSSEAPTATEAPKDDWSNKYENYFEEHPIINKLVEMENLEQGIKVFLRTTFVIEDDHFYLRYVIWEGGKKKQFDTTQELNSSTIHCFSNGEAYLETCLKGKKTEYVRTDGLDWADAESMIRLNLLLGLSNEELAKAKYDREEIMDDVLYDVLKAQMLRKTDSGANRWVDYYFFINRQTQELRLMRQVDTVEVRDYYMETVDPALYADVSEEMKKGKKYKPVDFMKKYAISKLKISFSAIGYDVDRIDFESMVQ